MEEDKASLPPCKFCSIPNTDAENESFKQVCCVSTCVNIAAQQECDALCSIGHATSADRNDGLTFPKERGSACCSGPTQSCARRTNSCNELFKAAHERYSARLAAVGCICKSLIERNLQSCCSSIRYRRRRSLGCGGIKDRAPGSSVRTARVFGGSKMSCSSDAESPGKITGCGRGAGACAEKTDACLEESDGCIGTTDTSDKGSSLSPSSPVQEAHGQRRCCDENSSCSTKDISPDTPGSRLQDTCCGKIEGREKYIKSNMRPTLPFHDIEKVASISEHVVLNVEGLTCVGCENKLFRSLDAIHGIHNLQTSLVMSQAEFDVGIDAGSVDEIIRQVAKTTGFRCKRLNDQGQSLGVLVPGDARDFVNQKKPYGVEEMVALGKQTARIRYDARILGARDLLENTFDAQITLAPPRPCAELETGGQHVRKTAFMTAFSSLLTIPVLILAWAPLPQHKTLYGAISLVLATIVQTVVAGPFYPSALKALLFTRVIEMDMLIVLSTSTAYIFSVIAFAYQVQGHPLPTGEFFQTSTLIVTLILVGRLVSAYARHKAVESISIRSLQISTALLIDIDNHDSREIDARLLQYGDTFKVLPDSCVATDGIVTEGTSEVDESNVTGEGVPVEKIAGSNVIAGSVNGSGTLQVRMTRLPSENTISEIAAMVDAAKFSKPKAQEIADRVASYFVPIIVTLTLITFVTWIAVGKALRHQSSSFATVQAMTYAIAVLIVSCPCAIGLAVPMVVVIAGGVSAKHGVVFKSAQTIEIARKVSHVVFDKTGTLTQGKMSVSAEICLSESRMSAASLVLGLTINSKHPVSAAIAAYLREQAAEPASIEDMKSITGNGVEGIWRGARLRGGNSHWLAVRNIPQVASLLSQGCTVFCVSLDEELLAIYGLFDSLRPDARSVVSSLQNRNIAVSVVSGDDDGPVQETARQLGVPPRQVRSRCSPGDKQKYIKAIMDHEHQNVLFCGDGTNDAVALAQANIGLHMNSGTDVAQSAADAVLIRPALEGILVLIDLSRAAFRRIVFNFAWSIVYNVSAVLLAAGVGGDVRIAPQYAALGELVSVLPAILIALQLRWFRRR